MKLRKRLTLYGYALAFASGLAACNAASFDSPSQVKTVRILAVQKDKPYAAPGDEITLKMLAWSGGFDEPEVTLSWIPGCVDPLGDLYYNCYAQPSFGAIAAGVPAGSDLDALLPHGDRFSLQVPGDAVSRRPPPSDPSALPYGLEYVFYAACAGHLGIAPKGGDQPYPFPIACYDDDQQLVTSDGFVPGYTALYVYEPGKNENHNPELLGLSFDGQPLGAGGADAAASQDGGAPAITMTVPRCMASKRDDCPGHLLQPNVSMASAEIDVTSGLREQLWIDYYATGGDFDYPIRLVNDAVQGWNDDDATSWRPPAEPGRVRIWAVVHDNRGGVTWSSLDVMVD